MGLEATEEQRAARDAFAGGIDLALIAGAGTGKTSTLMMMADATRKRGLYMAFNKATAVDAARRFGRNVDCRTAHSLAFAATGRKFRDRLNAPRIPARGTASLLGITSEIIAGPDRITPAHQARLVTGMIRGFCFSSATEVQARHLEVINGLSQPEQGEVAALLLPYAAKAWEDLSSPSGKLRFEHDHYMKMWALTRPVLPGEFIFLDEAQDTNPVLEEIFLAQRAQRVCVGDPAQQIYAWRSAKDIMSGFPARHLELTRSFRFGPRIAETANRWLRLAESSMRLTGAGPARSRIGQAAAADAVLCRNNADVMTEVLAFLRDGVPVAVSGGGDVLRTIAEAAQQLKAGRRTSHPELFLFRNWGEVQEYAEHDTAGQDLRAIVQLIDMHGPETIISAVERLSPEDLARVTVSTAHKAKGREWPSVRIGPGFDQPPVDDDGRQRPLSTAEARLIYVAVTRARVLLDPAGIAWADEYEQALGEPASLGDFPLTAQLKLHNSPVSVFLDTNLPDAHRAVSDYQRQIAGLPRPVQPFRAGHIVCGPVFAGSADIGGADADFIVGGLLLDCKATTRPERLGAEEIYQLAGYLLLDYHDEYRIGRVGLYLSRQGATVCWGVPEFLGLLGAREPLPTLRTRFRQFLEAKEP